MDKVIKKVGCRKSTLYLFGVSSSVFVLVGIFAIFQSITMENYFGRHDDEKGVLIFLGIIFLVNGLFDLFIAIIKSRLSICICEDKLYGTAGNGNFFKLISFEMNYNEIVSINLKSRVLVIEKRAEKLLFDVEDAKEIKKLIEEKMAEFK